RAADPRPRAGRGQRDRRRRQGQTVGARLARDPNETVGARLARDPDLNRSDAPGHNPVRLPFRKLDMRLRLIPAATAASVLIALSGCTWVHMAPGAKAVRVVASTPSGCEQRGEVEVSVKEKVGFYERNSLRVRDELEILARNEAPG